MGITSSKVYTSLYMPFVVERQLATEPINIMIGICGIEGNDIFRNQCIKINNENSPYSLLRFVETHNSLKYDFENNIKLTLMKNDKSNDIYYNLRTTEMNISDALSSFSRRWFKRIDMNSKELDKIAEFIKI